MLGPWILSTILMASPAASGQESGEMDLASALLVTPAGLRGPEEKAVTMLLDEVERRSRIRWTVVHEWPRGDVPVVALGLISSLPGVCGPYADALTSSVLSPAPEGYRILVKDRKVVLVSGQDRRGVLFGAGRLIREMRMDKDRIRLSDSLDITTSPKFPLRGHQLGYRPKVNSYDGWTVPLWEQYYRDLILFGTNAVEIMPPRTDDDADSPHFVMPQIEMMKHMSRLADEYDMDVWIWYPVLDVDPDKPDTIQASLAENESVFSKLSRVNAVSVPSGDPGHLAPKPLMQYLEKMTDVLHRSHPNAQMWVSVQGFNAEGLNEFLGLVQKEPQWLSGIVFGPQTCISLPELRNRVPARYPIRNYPDITHMFQCQFPVPDWDLAYAFTEHREVINPRPTDYAHIARLQDEYTNGFITYSEGCNDDVNKILWSSLGWDPDMDVIEILRQYARTFIGPGFEDGFAQGLLALELNWRGPLLTNPGVFTTLAQFQDMDAKASPQDKLNWRFQQGLYRAYYDAYNARRLLYETELQREAMDVLRQAPRLGPLMALGEAERLLDRAVLSPVAQDLRARVFELAEALFQSIRMQLSVPRYQAIAYDRGANLDLIDVPLNDRLWLKSRFEEIRQKTNDLERQQGIEEILFGSDPGPGGFYDNLGNASEQPHLVKEPEWSADPEFRLSPLNRSDYLPSRKMSWNTYAETRFDSPLKLRYENLDPKAQYQVRVVYAGDNLRVQMRLTADGQFEVHPYIPKPSPMAPISFDVPREATADGRLLLSFNQETGRGGNGRGCQVAEVWLMRKIEE